MGINIHIYQIHDMIIIKQDGKVTFAHATVEIVILITEVAYRSSPTINTSAREISKFVIASSPVYAWIWLARINQIST